jgi:hypothetical protein
LLLAVVDVMENFVSLLFFLKNNFLGSPEIFSESSKKIVVWQSV